MPLSDGDPAQDGDVWFRVATNESHIRKGCVHHSAFGGNAIAPPAKEKNRPCTRELSGRLRSLAGNVEEEARAFCDAQSQRGGGIKFSGVMYVHVAKAKLTYENKITTAVHFTPLDRDKAHADFTFKGWNEMKDEKERFLLWLTDKFEGLHPGQLHHLPNPDTRLAAPDADLPRGSTVSL